MYITVVLMTAFFAAFTFLLFDKWNVWEYLQINAPTEFVYKLMSCEFCRLFWICAVISLFLAFSHWYYLFTPIFAVPIARKLL